MRFYALILIYLFGGIFSIYMPLIAAGLFLWNDIFRPLEFAYMPGGFPHAQYVTLILLVSFIVNLLRGTFRPIFSSYSYLLIIWIIWMGISTLLSPYPSATAGYIELIKIFIPLLLISTIINNNGDVQIIIVVLIFSVGIWASRYGIAGILTGPNPVMAIAGGQMTDRNDFTAAIIPTLPMYLYFFLTYDFKYKKYIRLFFLLIFFLSLSAIIFSLSRGASVAATSLLFYYTIFISKKKIRAIILMIMLLFVGYLSVPQSFLDRMSTIEIGVEQTEGSAVARMHHMTSALKAMGDNMLFGVGPKAWLDIAHFYSGYNYEPHNIWIKCGVELGLPGLILYLFIMLFTLIRLNKVKKRSMINEDRNNFYLSSLLSLSIMGYLTALTFLNQYFSEYLFAWIGLANSYAIIYNNIEKKPQNYTSFTPLITTEMN